VDKRQYRYPHDRLRLQCGQRRDVGQRSKQFLHAFTYDNLMHVTSVDNSGTPNIPHVVLASQYL